MEKCAIEELPPFLEVVRLHNFELSNQIARTRILIFRRVLVPSSSLAYMNYRNHALLYV